MTRLHFKNDTLKRIVQHSQKVKRKIPYEDKHTKKMGVWLVKDDGIYLMAPTHEETAVCYAQGFSPNVKDLWDKTYAVSRDDFAEFIPLNDEQVANILAAPKGQTGLTVELTDTEICTSTYDYRGVMA